MLTIQGNRVVSFLAKLTDVANGSAKVQIISSVEGSPWKDESHSLRIGDTVTQSFTLHLDGEPINATDAALMAASESKDGPLTLRRLILALRNIEARLGPAAPVGHAVVDVYGIAIDDDSQECGFSFIALEDR